MPLNALTTLAHPKEFLAATQPVAFSVLSPKDECYQWLQATLLKVEYPDILSASERPRPPLSQKNEWVFPAAAHSADSPVSADGKGDRPPAHHPGLFSAVHPRGYPFASRQWASHQETV
jgi:hypothetical protein